MTIQLSIKNHHSDNTSNAETCLSEAVEAAEQVWSKDVKYSKPIVAMDVGKYGSTSWHKDVNMIKTASQFDSIIVVSQPVEVWTMAARGITNSGYIAALQRTLASWADCLVLLGGGNFLDLALNDYLSNHPNKEQQCVCVVCTVYWKRFRSKLDG